MQWNWPQIGDGVLHINLSFKVLQKLTRPAGNWHNCPHGQQWWWNAPWAHIKHARVCVATWKPRSASVHWVCHPLLPGLLQSIQGLTEVFDHPIIVVVSGQILMYMFHFHLTHHWGMLIEVKGVDVPILSHTIARTDWNDVSLATANMSQKNHPIHWVKPCATWSLAQQGVLCTCDASVSLAFEPKYPFAADRCFNRWGMTPFSHVTHIF